MALRTAQAVAVSVALSDELSLTTRVRAGDTDAFRVIFSTYYGLLCGFVLSYVHEDAVAEDLVQELFAIIWERRARWTPTDGVRQYLFGAARNKALDYLRHAQVVSRAEAASPTDSPVPGMGHGPADAEHQLRSKELADACRQAIHALPERQRTIVTLRWQHDMKHADIARILGISVKGVETQLGRAVKTLRHNLQGIWP